MILADSNISLFDILGLFMISIHQMASTVCTYIRQSTSACVITNMLYLRHTKDLPKPVRLVYIVTDVDYNSGKL